MNELLKMVKRGDIIEIQRLVQAKVGLNEEDSQGWTPLFMAAGKGDVRALDVLIEAGADVNHGSETGFTPLFSAVVSGHPKAVKVLLDAGASAGIKVDGKSLTKYIGAKGSSREEIFRMLKDSGAE